MITFVYTIPHNLLTVFICAENIFLNYLYFIPLSFFICHTPKQCQNNKTLLMCSTFQETNLLYLPKTYFISPEPTFLDEPARFSSFPIKNSKEHYIFKMSSAFYA